MALIVPHQSQQGIQTANGGQAAQYRSASAFTTPGQENLGRGLQQLAHGMNKLGGVIFDAEIQKRQEQMELALLEDMQKFQMESQAWSDNYQKNFQGKDAVNAEADAQTFYKEKVDSLRQRWNGNERAQLYIQRNAGGVAVSGVNSMRDYGNKQQEAWKDSVFAGQMATFKGVASDWRSTPGEIQAAYRDFAGKNTAYLISKGMDPTAAQIQTDKVYREAMSQRVEQSFVENINNGNMAGARASLETMKHGDAADFAAQYESGPAGSKAIGYDGTGGTSYGKFQISSKAGTFDDWLGWLDKNGHKAVAEELRGAGPADTGSRSGKMVNAWQALVASGAITDEMQRQFIQESHIDPALSKLPEHVRGAIQSDAGLYQAFFSTAVQHGAGGAVKLFTRNWGKGNGDKDAFLDALYADRKTQFSGSTDEVQKSVAGRFDRERALLGAASVPPEKIHSYQQMLQIAEADSQAESLYEQVSTGKMVESKAWEQVATIEDLKVRRAVRQGLTERLNIAKVQERENTLNAGERAYDDMTNLANSKNKSEAAILSDMYKLRLDAEIKARAGTAADKAYFRSVDQMYSASISRMGITNRSDPGVFIDAQNAIIYGKVTSTRDLKAAYPTLAFRDMERLEGVLKSTQQVNLAEVNRFYDIYAGLNPDLPADAEERAAHKARRMMLIQNVIDSAKETNRGSDPEWIKAKVAQFFVAGEDRGFLYDANMTAGEAMTKGVAFYPKITEEVRARIKADFDKDPVLKDEYLKKHEHLNYAIRARYWDELQQGLGAREPERPDDVPDDAVWDKARMGWVGTNPQTGRSGFRPLVVR